MIVVTSLALAYFFIDTQDIYNLFLGEIKYIESNCSIENENCKVILEDKSEIEFFITPNILVLKPIEFNLKTKNLNINSAEFKIFGLNMDMGVYNFKLKKIDENEYKGTGIIPLCIVDMKWQGDLIIKKENEKKIGIIFKFKTKN